MQLVTLIGEYANILNILLVMLVFPILMKIKKSKERDSTLISSMESSTHHIEALHHEMIAIHRRQARVEDAVLFLANDEKVKDVIAILRGFHHDHDEHAHAAHEHHHEA